MKDPGEVEVRDNQSAFEMPPGGSMCAGFPMFDHHDDNVSRAATTVHPNSGNEVDGWIDELDVSRVNTIHPVTSGITPGLVGAAIITARTNSRFRRFSYVMGRVHQ